MIYLPVPKNIGDFHDLLDQLDAFFIVAGQVVAVGDMERVDVVAVGAVFFVDHVEREVVRAGADRPAAFALGEELVLGDDFRFRVVRDELDVDVLVLGAQEAGHPEEERAGDVFFKLAHRTGRIHHRQHDGLRMRLLNLLPRLVAQVVGGDLQAGLAAERIALDRFDQRALLVDVVGQPFFANVVKTDVGRGHPIVLLALQVRQFEVFEQQLLNFVDGDFRLKIVDARLIPGPFALGWPMPLLTARVLAQHVADLRFPVALSAVLLLVEVVSETVLIQGTDRHFDNLPPVVHDDALFGDEIGQILFDRFPDFFLMADLVLIALAVQRPVVFGEDE